MHRRLVFVVALIISVLFGTGVFWAFPPTNPVPETPLEKERRQAFAWMDSLGFPDVKNLPFVRVKFLTFDADGNLSVRPGYHGFVVEDKGVTFTVLDMNMEFCVCERTAQATTPGQDYEPADLNTYVAETYAPLRVSEASHLFLAWVLSRRGQDEMSARIFREASAAPLTPPISYSSNYGLYQIQGINYYNIDPSPPPAPVKQGPIPSLQERAAKNLAELEMGRALWGFREAKVTRAELLQKFEHVARHFPKCQHHARACEIASLLRVMVAEDNAHAEAQTRRKPFNQLSDKEQIAELIFQLRNQEAIDENGAPSILEDSQSPARRLIAKGYAAVPLLLQALDDKRLTRILHYRQIHDRQSIYTVGHCAEIILGEISGLGYSSTWIMNTSYAEALSEQDREPGALQRAVFKAWYADLRQKGEKRWLIEAVRRGDQHSLELARRLLERDGDDAVPTLAATAREASDGYRRMFVEMICSIPGDHSTEFLLKEVKEGPFICQLVAAGELAERERPEALAAMIAEWREENPRSRLASVAERERDGRRLSLAYYLMNSLKPEAIAALAGELHKQPVELRTSILQFMSRDMANQAADSEKLWAAMEKLLAGCLDDCEEWRGSKLGDIGFADPRVCDVAAHMLAEGSPEKYSFNIGDVLSVRNRRLAEVKNVWRRANKLPQVSVPRPRSIAAVPAKLVVPHLEMLLVDPVFLGDPDQHKRSRAEIEKLGPGAFWPVMEFRDGLKNKADYDLVDNLAKRLACTITDVEFAPRSLKPDSVLSKRLEDLKNQPLDAKSIMEAAALTAKDLRGDVHGVEFSSVRSGDGTGFVLVIDLLGRERMAGRSAPVPVEEVTRPSVPVPLPGNNVQLWGAPILWEAVPAATAKPAPPVVDEAAKAEARENARKRLTHPAEKVYFCSRVRVGMGTTGNLFPIKHSSSGHHFTSMPWYALELEKALREALNSAPGEPIEITLCFARNPQQAMSAPDGGLGRFR